MRSGIIIRRSIAAIAMIAIASAAAPWPASASHILDTDTVKLTDSKVDFGGSAFAFSDPVGSGTVEWTINSGYYTPRLTGTLHLNNASGVYARMHISYWDGGGGHIDTRHGGTVQAPDNSHHSWSVDLSPITLSQIVEVHVCTETSTNGVTFTIVDCKTRLLN